MKGIDKLMRMRKEWNSANKQIPKNNKGERKKNNNSTQINQKGSHQNHKNLQISLNKNPKYK
jgi:hypothetical protein